MMRNATRDLLRLSLTASAVAGILLFANFEASRAVVPEAGAMARTDSLRYGRTISEDRHIAQPDFSQPARIEPRDASPADATASHSGKVRTLLALAQ